MLTEAAGQAQAAQIPNVNWAQGSSENLPSELGRFDLVTMGRSFHWMDRENVLNTLDDMVNQRGGSRDRQRHLPGLSPGEVLGHTVS